MLELHCGEFDVLIFDQPDYPPGSQLSDRATCLIEDDYYLSSEHAVIVRQNEADITSHLFAADGGATGIHEHSALLHNNCLFLAVGRYLCALEIPSLDLMWATQVDWATCFGVHLPPRRDCLISHGELEISRLNFDGEIEWQGSGADIFTGTLTTFENHLEVEDWEGQHYRFEIENGESRLI